MLAGAGLASLNRSRTILKGRGLALHGVGRPPRRNCLLDAGTKAEFDQQFRAVQVLYFAMLASLAGYLVIGLVLGSTRVPAAVASPTNTAFYLFSLGLAAAAFLVKKRMVRPDIARIVAGGDQGISWLLPFWSFGKLCLV